MLFPDANHVLKQVTTEDVNANMATYSDPDLPLVSHLVDTVAKFVTRK